MFSLASDNGYLSFQNAWLTADDKEATGFRQQLFFFQKRVHLHLWRAPSVYSSKKQDKVVLQQ